MYSKRANRHADAGRTSGEMRSSLGKRKSQYKDKDPIRRPRESSGTSNSSFEDPPSHRSEEDRDRGPPSDHASNERRPTRRLQSTRDQEVLSESRRHGPSLPTSNSDHTLKKKKTDVHVILRPTRAIPRCVGPFVNIRTTFLSGFELATDVNQDPTLRSRLDKDDEVTLTTYLKILEIVPGLDKLAERTAADSSHALVNLAIELDHAGSKGRSDDCGSLRENGLKYIPRNDTYIEVDFGMKKELRGFSHPTTARLLCPRHWRDAFDRNLDAFCNDVLNGLVEITHDNWPTFLYPEDGYDPDVIDHTLLQGPFLLAVFRHIFTAPCTALKMTPGKVAGKKTIAELYDIK
ncbi:hypothetical protein BC826DRAFT_976713, partial [Russula brevipes]